MKRFYRLKDRKQHILAKDHVYLFTIPVNSEYNPEDVQMFLKSLKEQVTKAGVKGVYMYGNINVTDLGISNNID